MVYVYAFDIDGTLTPIRSSWQFIHNILNTRRRTKNYFKYFLEGMLSYDEWVVMELRFWKNISVEIFKKILYSIPWRSGIEELIKFRQKKTRDIFVAVSGGFSFLCEKVVNELRFDLYICVEPEIENEKIVGYAHNYPDFDSKGIELIEHLHNNRIEYDKLICVGDNINDINMFKYCDISIAFCPVKTLRKDDVDIFIRSCNMKNLIKILYTIK